jgi:hypothetical protein
MSPMEKETKLVLSPEDFESVRRAGNIVDSRDQLNVYLHDPTRLGEETGYLRVRFETGRDPLATLKIPVDWAGDMRRMVEVERPLRELGPSFYPRPRRWAPLDTRVPEGFTEHFQSLGIHRLRRLGWMRNFRTVVELERGKSVELDRTLLPGRQLHYEVEIEHPVDEEHLSVVEAVKALAPSAVPSRVGKFSRFLSAAGLA